MTDLPAWNPKQSRYDRLTDITRWLSNNGFPDIYTFKMYGVKEPLGDGAPDGAVAILTRPGTGAQGFSLDMVLIHFVTGKATRTGV